MRSSRLMLASILVVGSWGDDFGLQSSIDKGSIEDWTVLPKAGIDCNDLHNMTILSRSVIDLAPPQDGLLCHRYEDHLSSRLEACASPTGRRILANPSTNNSGKSGVNLQSASPWVIPTQQTAVSLVSAKLTRVMNISAPDLDPTVSSKSAGISSSTKNLSIRQSHLQYEYWEGGKIS
jgi:hypothetical protein